MTQQKYKAENVTIKIGDEEIRGLVGGSFIEIKPPIAQDTFCVLGGYKEDITINFTSNPDASHRKWVELFLGDWNNGTEND